MSRTNFLWLGLVPVVLSSQLIQSATFSEASVRNSRSYRPRLVSFLDSKLNQHVYFSNQVAQKKSSPKVKEYYNSAERKFEGKDYQGALDDLNRVIQLDPNYVQAYKNRGGTKVLLKDFKGALADYNRAIQLDSNFVNAYIGRGFLKMVALNDYPGALNDLNRAVKIQPDSVDAYSNLAVLKYVYMKDKSGGISDLQKVIKLFQQKGEQKRAANAAKTLNEWRMDMKKSGAA